MLTVSAAAFVMLTYDQPVDAANDAAERLYAAPAVEATVPPFTVAISAVPEGVRVTV